jgi:hypothetical protein
MEQVKRVEKYKSSFIKVIIFDFAIQLTYLIFVTNILSFLNIDNTQIWPALKINKKESKTGLVVKLARYSSIWDFNWLKFSVAQITKSYQPWMCDVTKPVAHSLLDKNFRVKVSLNFYAIFKQVEESRIFI